MIQALSGFQTNARKYRMKGFNESENICIPIRNLKLPCILVIDRRKDADSIEVQVIEYDKFIRNNKLDLI